MKFRVEDMSCGHCTAAIQKSVTEAGGSAATDLSSRTVTVEGIDAQAALQAIQAAGYTAEALD